MPAIEGTGTINETTDDQAKDEENERIGFRDGRCQRQGANAEIRWVAPAGTAGDAREYPYFKREEVCCRVQVPQKDGIANTVARYAFRELPRLGCDNQTGVERTGRG